MKILLAVDGSEFTKKMLAYLATHDDLFATGHDYTIFTVQLALPPRARAAYTRSRAICAATRRASSNDFQLP